MDTKSPQEESAPQQPGSSSAPPRTPREAPPHWPAPPPPPAPPSLLRRVLGWAVLLMLGFGMASLFGYFQSVADYYDRTGDIKERYHSLDKYATDKVAVIKIEGLIVDGEGFVQNQIEKVREDEDVKAIVVRVDSPGGTVTGSDYILHELVKLRDEKKVPLVVSMGSLAASGGYYVSMAVGGQEDSIFAEPTTTTGSIGVIIPHYDITGLMEQYNVKDDSIASGPHKQMLSMTREMSEEERALAQSYVDASFKRFKDVIKKGRPVFEKEPEALDKLATGQIYTADEAKELGLVDEIGFLEDAISRAVELAKLEDDKVRAVHYKAAPSLLGELSSPLGQASRSPFDQRTLLELSVPRAYYLLTTLPALAASAK